MKRVNKAQSVRNYMNANPDATTTEIAKKCKVTNQYVYQVKADEKKRKTKLLDIIQELNESMLENPLTPTEEDPRVPQFDNVNHPPHYKTGGVETIDFIEAKELGYHLGNVIKYVSRAKHKGNELEDLKKAQWYLERAIMKLHI